MKFSKTIQHLTRTTLLLSLMGSSVILPSIASANVPSDDLFPGRAEDLGNGEYWYRRKAVHGGGDQKDGYDLTGVRFDATTRSWTTNRPRTNGSQNAHRIIYGKPVYATTSGKVIRCWRNAPENPTPGESHPGRLSTPKTIGGGGNFILLDIGNNQQELIAHLQPSTVPSSLCPFNQVFMTDASDKSESTVPIGQQALVKPGTYLGRVGNSGASSGPHLHIHRTTTSGQPVPLPFARFWHKGINSTVDAASDWQLETNKVLPPGKIAILPPFKPGAKEVARHGIPADQYQAVFNHITGSGYRLDWIDGFQVNGKVYYNAIFRPDTGGKWSAFHGLSSSQYQSKFDQYTQAGYRPTQVESYLSGSSIRYAVIFRKESGPSYSAYHGRTAAQHQQLFDQKTQAGFRPTNISVVSVNGQRSYTALYEKQNIGSFIAKSFLTPAQYQQQFDANLQNGRQLAYLNAYLHNGEPHFSAIWNSASSGNFSARHGLTSGQYQQHWESNLQSGRLTQVVTGYEGGNTSRYAALWRK